jgi:hypothetical protein
MEGHLARVEAKLDAALEDRLARVEAFAEDISVRMARLEALLTQLVGSHVTTS